MNTTKKTAFGILGVAATTALIAGASMPAMADDHDSSTTTTWSEYTTTLAGALQGGDLGFSNESPVVIAPSTEVGDVLGGDIASGNANGNSVGNGNAIGSGNDSAIGSGNTTSIDGVDATVDDVLDSTVGDITGDVSGMVDGLIGDLDLGVTGLFED